MTAKETVFKKTPSTGGAARYRRRPQQESHLCLQTELQQYRDIFDNARIGLCLDVEDGSVLGLMNAAFASMHGYEVHELVGKPVAELFPPYLRESLSDIASFVDSKDFTSFETEHIRKDGSVFPVLVDATVIRDACGNFLYRIINVKDISEIKRAETELRLLNEQLEQKVRERTEALERSQESRRRSERLASLGTLAAGIAHEINNPLNSILMAADYALRKGKLDSVTEKSLEQIRKEVKRCSEVTRSVLSFAREEASQKVRKNLNIVVGAAVGMAKAYAHLTNVTLNLSAAPPMVALSETDVERAMINVIQNAIQAAPGCSIDISSWVEEDFAYVSIRDDGPGIAPDIIPRIFDPFFTTRNDSGGTGLGLSMVHSIMKDHGGAVTVTSVEGEGATFRLQFPLQPAPLP